MFCVFGFVFGFVFSFMLYNIIENLLILDTLKDYYLYTKLY